ncbi:MAG: DUF1553 domain-containing protein, partial [Gemmataceae bacterium]
RLLASPAYGERWGRHWLDVVRYADTAGDNSDYPVPQIYKYRNWVIDALNKDMPYDRFVRAQLAGDLLPASDESERRANLIATGYLANARRFGSYEDARYPWHLTIEDTIDNFGRTFLGLTINCCRCHDHKFDPLTNEDYYALYGFFSSTRYPWPGIELDKVPKDMVPLAPAEDIQRVMKERQAELARFDEEIKKLEQEKKSAEKSAAESINKKIAALRKEREAFVRKPLPYETAYAVIDGRNEPKKRIGQVGNARVQIKGDPERPGKEVPRRFPTVLGGEILPADSTGSGRLQLASWLVAEPIFARVMVNRVWHWHFGRGLAPTPSDFGKQGRPPTHPELLEFLADYFATAQDGQPAWSLKKMHRLLMLSKTYRLSSDEQPGNLEIDVDNDYLWRARRHRLDAESIRDTMLAVSGGLERRPGGPHPFPEPTTWGFTQHKPFKAVYESNHRSVYLMTQRIQRHPFLALFDGSDTNASTATRVTSTTPLQALYLMNDPFVHEQAGKLAARLIKEQKTDQARTEQLYLLLFGRPPAASEQTTVADYLTKVHDKVKDERKAWESLVRAMFLSNEFVYLN